MRMATSKKISLIWLVVGFSMLTTYNNCSRPPGDLKFDQGSNASYDITSGSCDDFQLNKYKTDVYPFFKTSATCLGCHIEGGVGLGLFASSKVEVSFAAFQAAGLSKVSFMATNPAHKPPYTGLQNQTAINNINTKWSQTQTQYIDCVARSQNGGVNESILTAPKAAPQIYSDDASRQTLTWQLDLASDLHESVTRSIPAEISVEVRVLYQTISGVSLAKGYIFSNPMMRVKDSSQQIIIEGLFFHLNGQPLVNQTTYTSLSRVITSTIPVPLMSGQANTLVEPISTTDTFQLYIRRLVPTSGTEDSPPPMTPILRLSDTSTGSETLLRSRTADVSILRDAGIVRWCLSESPTRPASTEAPCQSSMTGDGIVNGWSIRRPLRYELSAGDGRKTLYLWVADQNLNMNADPALVMVDVDTTAPVAPTIASINVTDTQVASMTVTHPNESEITGWCVWEQPSYDNPPGTIALNDECWNWSNNNTKPTTVGFKGTGMREVWVYVRDRAGNISPASNMMTPENPFPAITFLELTSGDGSINTTTGRFNNPRAVFRNRCYACHSSATAPGFSTLRLFEYGSAIGVADSGVLVSRINNALSPMPNVAGGLMPQRERDLIKLWTMPETGNNPLP